MKDPAYHEQLKREYAKGFYSAASVIMSGLIIGWLTMKLIS